MTDANNLIARARGAYAASLAEAEAERQRKHDDIWRQKERQLRDAAIQTLSLFAPLIRNGPDGWPELSVAGLTFSSPLRTAGAAGEGNPYPAAPGELLVHGVEEHSEFRVAVRSLTELGLLIETGQIVPEEGKP